jgi:hypothetical protein
MPDSKLPFNGSPDVRYPREPLCGVARFFRDLHMAALKKSTKGKIIETYNIEMIAPGSVCIIENA